MRCSLACRVTCDAGDRHKEAGSASAGGKHLQEAHGLYAGALRILERRLPRRHPDYVACLINTALLHAALLANGASAGGGDGWDRAAALTACRRGVRAVRAAGGEESRLWIDMERAVEAGLGEAPAAGAEPVMVCTVRCGVGLADLAASLSLAGGGQAP